MDHFTLARTILAAEGAQDFLGRVANNLGEVALLQGDFSAARSWFDQALEQMTTQVYRIDAYLNRGLTAHVEGDLAAASTDYMAALTLIEALERHEIAALVHFRLGQIAASQEAWEQARSAYARAIAAVESMHQPLEVESLQVSLMGRWQVVYEALVLLHLKHNELEQALEVTERDRARALAATLARQRPTSGPTHFALAGLQATLAPDELVLSYFVTGIFGVESMLLRNLPPAASRLRQIQIQPSTIWVFAIGREQLAAQACQLDPTLLLPTSAYQVDGRRFLRPGILKRLFSALIAPVAGQLAAARQAWVLPHGPLHQVPWSALTAADGRAVLDFPVALQQCPSATTLLNLRLRGAVKPPKTAPDTLIALHSIRRSPWYRADTHLTIRAPPWPMNQGIREKILPYLSREFPIYTIENSTSRCQR